MKDLAFLTSPDMSKAEVATNHVVIAEYAGIERTSIRLLINKHKKDFEQFGKLIFEISTLENSRGQKVKIYQLNRNQAMLLITYLDNTEVVRNFKIALVKRFDELEKDLQARQIARAVEKPQGKTLHQSISEWAHFPRHGNRWHTIIRTLLASTVTGLTAKGIKARDDNWRKEKTLLDLLTLEEKGMATHSSILAWRIPMDRGAWRAAVHGVAKSQTRLSN